VSMQLVIITRMIMSEKVVIYIYRFPYILIYIKKSGITEDTTLLGYNKFFVVTADSVYFASTGINENCQ
jgi:hypothetical protein